MNLYRRKLIAPLTIILFMMSCDLNINDDPNNPTTAELHELLPNAQIGVIEPFSSLVNAITSTVVQTRVNNRYDNYIVSGSTVDGMWTAQLYGGGLKDLEEIIEDGTEKGSYHYVGIAKLMKAYTFSLMVDLWNDIPYSDAFKPELKEIGYDSAEDIYNKLFDLINEGLSDLDKTSTLSPKDDDLLYGGEISKWKKMGNTLLFKMYNQIRLVDPANSKAKLQQLINDGGMFGSIEDDLQLTYGTTTSPENRIRLFVDDYVIRLDNRMCNYFYNHLSANNDPRIPYYIYNQTAGVFVGRDAGNPDGLSQFEDQDKRSFHGVYVSGGQFDAGEGGVTNGEMGLKGAGIYRMMTYAMRLFIEAEAVLMLDVTGSASLAELFESAIREAMEKVNEVGVGDIPDADVDNYVNARLAEFNVADDDGKLKLIMMEKYTHLFGNGMEQYNDWRRTNIPDDLVLVLQTGLTLNRFPYPVSENPPTMPPNDQKVFWDK